MRTVIYTRVSSEEQLDGFSLSAQAEQCRRYADQKGWTVVRLYEERGRSGKSAQRP
jgi:site-specific DNA recombinase